MSCLYALQDTAADSPGRNDHGIQSVIEDDSTQHSAHSSQSATIKGNLNPAEPMQKSKSRKQVGTVTAAIKELKELDKAINIPQLVDEECEAFGKHVAIQLKKLHPEHCILAQEDIQRVLTKYRLAGLSYDDSGLTPPPVSVSLAHSIY